VTASLASLVPLTANAQTEARLDVSLGGTVASNPYLRDGSDTGAVGADLTILPYLNVTDDDTTVTFDGAVSFESFFDQYDVDESVRFGASLENRLSERTTLSADVNFRSSEAAARRFYGTTDLGGLEQGEFPDQNVVDPTLANVSGRTSRLDMTGSIEQIVSANDIFGATLGLGLTRVESATGEDYRDFKSALNYSHRTDERTSLTATFDVGYADYLGRQAGDGVFLTGRGGLKHDINETMYMSLQFGASYAEVEALVGGKQSFTDWSASFDLCDILARETLCVTGSRAPRPTSLGGLTMVNAVSASYGHDFASGNASISASYSRSGRSDSSSVLLGRRGSEVAVVRASYRHDVGRQLSAFVTTTFTSSDEEFATKHENYQILLGLTYRFGRAS